MEIRMLDMKIYMYVSISGHGAGGLVSQWGALSQVGNILAIDVARMLNSNNQPIV